MEKKLWQLPVRRRPRMPARAGDDYTTVICTFSHFQLSTDDDSDADEVIDYLSNSDKSKSIRDAGEAAADWVNAESHINGNPFRPRKIRTDSNYSRNNIVPTISITPHSPGAKHNNILGTSLILSPFRR